MTTKPVATKSNLESKLNTLDPQIIASLVIGGDMKRLTPEQKVAYYNYRCSQLGLDASARPFDLVTLNGKEQLYANAGCAQMLTAKHNLSYRVVGREQTGDIYMVTVEVTDPSGRVTSNIGAVAVASKRGDDLANAFMKATTKAIRRSVFAHMGLGMQDETEVETINGAATATWSPAPTALSEEKPRQINEAEFHGMLAEFSVRLKAAGRKPLTEDKIRSWHEAFKENASATIEALQAKIDSMPQASPAKTSHPDELKPAQAQPVTHEDVIDAEVITDNTIMAIKNNWDKIRKSAKPAMSDDKWENFMIDLREEFLYDATEKTDEAARNNMILEGQNKYMRLAGIH